jgi:hypothetical protein
MLKSKVLFAVKQSKRSRQLDAGVCPDGAIHFFNDRSSPVRYSKYADNLSRDINHTGWFCDPHQAEQCRGTVGTISHGRFLAGYELMDSGAKCFFARVYGDAVEAAHAADEEARIYAEKEYEYNEAWNEGGELRGIIEEKKEDICGYWPARHHPRVRADIDSIIGDIRAFEKELSALVRRHNLSF